MAQAIDIAGYGVVEFGKPYAEVVALLHRAADRLGIKVVGFSDLSVEDVAIDCDPPLLQARLAGLRKYNEPFRVVNGNRVCSRGYPGRSAPRAFTVEHLVRS